MRPEHDCAQVERDCMDLHQALAEAIKRLHSTNHLLQGVPWQADVEDLLDVLDRTSKPETPAARQARRERARNPGGFAV